MPIKIIRGLLSMDINMIKAHHFESLIIECSKARRRFSVLGL